MKAVRKAIAIVLTAGLLMSYTSCSIDNNAAELANSFVVSMLSLNIQDMRSKTSSASDTGCYDRYDLGDWRTEYVRRVLSSSLAVSDIDDSTASRMKKTGGIAYTISVPDLSQTEGQITYSNFDSMISSAPMRDINVMIPLEYSDGSWYIGDPSAVLDAVYGPLYDYDWSFLYPRMYAVSSVTTLDLPADTLCYTDIRELSYELSIDDEYVRTGLPYDITVDITRSGESTPLYSYAPDMDDADPSSGTVLITLDPSDIDRRFRYFPQGDFTLDVYNFGEYCCSCEFDTVLTDDAFSDEDIFVMVEWLDADSNGGYYNVNGITAKMHVDYEYLISGKSFSVTFDISREGEMLAEGVTSVFDGRNCICTYTQEDKLDTGLYTLTLYNNGTQIASSDVMVTHNFNETSYTELETADVSDEATGEDDDEHTLVIYSYRTADRNLLNEYSDIDFTVVSPAMNVYRHVLDSALASGDNAPDLFICESELVPYYADSEYTIPVNDLGISYDELRYMYEYTFRLGTDGSGVIKGLTWEITPGAVFYNRDCAENVLGVREPGDVARYFETWGAFLDTARAVREMSNGNRRVIAGLADIQDAYMGGRSDLWTDGTTAYMPSYMAEYFDLVRALTSEELTFGSSRWSNEWTGHMNDRRTLSYWGTLWLGDLLIANTHSGKWGVVKSPVNYYDGGSWIFATSYNDMRASSAQLIRDITMDQSNLREMASDGNLVNAINIMTSCAEDDDFCRSYLDGQNPYGIFADTAWQMNTECSSEYDSDIDAIFLECLDSYAGGTSPDSTRMQQLFLDRVESEVLG